MRNMGKIILGVIVSVAFVGIYLGSMQKHMIDGAMQELQSVKGSTNGTAGQAADQAANGTAGQAADQAANGTAGQSEDQAANEAVGQAADQAANEAVGKSADQAEDGAAGKSADQAEDGAAGQAADQAADEAAGQKADRVLLSVEPLLQYPELPTGCEVTSLAMALSYAGCQVSKTVLADDYLPKCREGEESFTDYFWGDPRRDDGYGCLAPAIVTCAKKYLRAVKSDLKVYDLSNKPLSDLYDELRLGRPVIVWGCMDPDWEIVYTEVVGENGRSYEWPANEHCMLLVGFDLEKGTITVNDPLKGKTEYTIESFARHYNNIGMQAVVIE